MNKPTPPVFSAFDRIRIINLVERTDRRKEMEEELARVGLLGDPRVAFFPALRFSDPRPFLRPGSRGNFEGRIALFDEAAEAGESILILEDDCDFVFPDIETYRLPDEWDIFYGAYNSKGDPDFENANIEGSHFMGFSAGAAKISARYFRDYLKPDFRVDALAAADPGFNPAVRPPIDGAFVWLRRAYPELKTVFAQLGIQRPSRTDVGDQKFYDRIIGLRAVAGAARKVLRR